MIELADAFCAYRVARAEVNTAPEAYALAARRLEAQYTKQRLYKVEVSASTVKERVAMFKKRRFSVSGRAHKPGGMNRGKQAQATKGD